MKSKNLFRLELMLTAVAQIMLLIMITNLLSLDWYWMILIYLASFWIGLFIGWLSANIIDDIICTRKRERERLRKEELLKTQKQNIISSLDSKLDWSLKAEIADIMIEKELKENNIQRLRNYIDMKRQEIINSNEQIENYIQLINDYIGVGNEKE